MHRLTERTYVNADSTKVVPEGSVEAAFLLGIAGDEISTETAARLGLTATSSTSTYADLTVADLRELAETRGLDVPSKPKKADLIGLLEDSDQATADAGTAGTADAGSPAKT